MPQVSISIYCIVMYDCFTGVKASQILGITVARCVKVRVKFHSTKHLYAVKDFGGLVPKNYVWWRKHWQIKRKHWPSTTKLNLAKFFATRVLCYAVPVYQV